MADESIPLNAEDEDALDEAWAEIIRQRQQRRADGSPSKVTPPPQAPETPLDPRLKR